MANFPFAILAPVGLPESLTDSKVISPRSTGASITNGKFAIDKSHGLRPGDHRVILQAQRRTGKKIRDRLVPTEVEEMVIVNLKTDTLTAPVSVENAQQLEFNFSEVR